MLNIPSSFAYETAEPRKNIISNKCDQQEHHVLSKKNVINSPLVRRNKIIFASLYINLGLVKQYDF